MEHPEVTGITAYVTECPDATERAQWLGVVPAQAQVPEFESPAFS